MSAALQAVAGSGPLPPSSACGRAVSRPAGPQSRDVGRREIANLGARPHRHQEFIRFLNRSEAAAPAGKLVHAILDSNAVHKHPKVGAWLARHPRWIFHFTPTSCLRQCGRDLLRLLTRRRLQRGAFHLLGDLQAAINRYLGEHDRKPKPFIWTADPDRIIEKVNRGIG
jgi:hypothetical protein